MKITNTLSCDTHLVDYELQIDHDGVIFSLTDDHFILPRTVKIELRPDGGLNVLLYPTDQSEPHHLVLTTTVERL